MKKDNGQILLMVIVVLGVILFTTLFIIAGAQLYYQNSTYSGNEQKAVALAEAAIDKTLASLNATGGTYNPDPNQEISLGDGSYTVTVTTIDPANKVIEATGFYPSRAQAKLRRKIKIQASIGVGTSFNYGAQVGEGGLVMSNNSKVMGVNNVPGSVYSNGNIRMQNNAQITGDVYVAGGTQPTAASSNDCTLTCGDFKFGTSVGSNDQMDVAQSFQLSGPSPITVNKISLKLKKVNSPSGDLTVKILADVAGRPDKTEVLASTAIRNSLIASEYGFVDAVFAPSVSLNPDQLYWMVIIPSATSQSDYWQWQEDLNQGYLAGSSIWSPQWNAKDPVWNTIAGVDMTFQVFIGGVATSITGMPNSLVGGDVHANTVDTLVAAGDAYYQTQTDLTAGGQSCNGANTHCHPGSVDPVAQPMPLSDGNITDFKNKAVALATFTGDITTCPARLAAGKYIGSISLPGSCVVTVDHPIWITGNLTLTNNDTIKLDSTYGGSSGVMVVDGQVSLNNGNKLQGTGTTGSYLWLISTYDSRVNNNLAINIANISNSGIVYANNGIINIANNNNMTQVTAWKLTLGNGVVISYDQGLASTFFKSGPGGSFSLVKGTYQLQ